MTKRNLQTSEAFQEDLRGAVARLKALSERSRALVAPWTDVKPEACDRWCTIVGDIDSAIVHLSAAMNDLAIVIESARRRRGRDA